MKKLLSFLLVIFILTANLSIYVLADSTDIKTGKEEKNTGGDITYSVSFTAPAASDWEKTRLIALEDLHNKGYADELIQKVPELEYLLFPVVAVFEVSFDDCTPVTVKSVPVTDEKTDISLFSDILPAVVNSTFFSQNLLDGFEFTLGIRLTISMNGVIAEGSSLGAAEIGKFTVPAFACFKYSATAGAVNQNPTFVFYPYTGDIILKNPSLTGFTFAGWTLPDGTAVDRIPEGTRFFELTANWTEKIFKSRFVLTTRTDKSFIHCNNPNPSTFKASEGLVLADAEAPDGWIFAGWYGNPELTGEKITEIPAGTEKDVVLYAKWQTEDEAFDERAEREKLCDLDSDGQITPADARIALRAAVGLDVLDNEILKRADFGRQGKLTSTTARYILRISVGLDKLKDIVEFYEKQQAL